MATGLALPAARLLHKMAARGDGGRSPGGLVAPRGARRPDGAFLCSFVCFATTFNPRS